MDTSTVKKSNTPNRTGFKLFVAAGLAFIYISILFVLLLKWVNPPITSFMLQREINAEWNNRDDFNIKYDWSDWDDISPYVKVAAVTSEDQRFAEHWGLDIIAIQEAIEEHEGGKSLRGASTITQQVAKNLFLWPGQSFIRKGLEAWFAVIIELFWTKKRILEVYLNIVEFGDGIYGVKAASGTYFKTSPEKLDMMQSALMVTALPSPRRYNLANPSPYMKERRNWILQYMFYLGNAEYLQKLE